VLVLDDSTDRTTNLYNALNTKYVNYLRIEMENVLGVEHGLRPTSASVTPLGVLYQQLQATDLSKTMVDGVMLITTLVELMTMKVGNFKLHVNKKGGALFNR
jgi:hypothetical protein